MPSRLRPLGWALLALVAMILWYGGARILYEAWAAHHALRQLPPPGELVDVDGQKMHLYCTGTGSPTVVLDAGLGAFSLDWHRVQPDVAAFTRVCSYDRAGYGWSERSERPRTSQNIVQELHALLQAAGELGPYVIVGHSLGGFHARLFAHTYPALTAGVVLVDASHEDMGEHLPGVQRFPAQVTQLRTRAAHAPQGILRGSAQRATVYPTDIAQYLKQHATHLLTSAGELEVMMSTSAEQVRGARVFGDTPLYVLSRSPTWRGAEALKARAGLDVEAIWQSYQHDLASLSSTSQHWVADTSGHMIPQEDPSLIRDAVYEIVQQNRARSGHSPAVFLNHVNTVLDAATHAAIAASDFVQRELASVVETTVTSGNQAWTGLYLFGEHTYIELFASGTGVNRPRGSSAIAFGVEVPEAAHQLAERLTNVSPAARHTLRTRTLGERDIPWFYQASINAAQYQDIVRSWVMEIHPNYLRTRFPDIDPAQDGIGRRHYLHRIYRPERLLQDIRHVTLALPPDERIRLEHELEILGYTVTQIEDRTEAEGPGLSFTLLPATPEARGLRRLDLTLTRPYRGLRTYRFGTSTLQFHDNLTATWTF